MSIKNCYIHALIVFLHMRYRISGTHQYPYLNASATLKLVGPRDVGYNEINWVARASARS